MKNNTDTPHMIWREVFRHCYPEDTDLRRILLQHSQSVAIKSLQIVSLHPELKANRDFIINAAMLHDRSEEHTSELQSRQYLVCRLLLEKKKKKQCITN